MVNINANINCGRSNSEAFDVDAQAFFTTAGITDAIQKLATNTLVLGLKAAGLWTPSKAIYPFVGGTATTHKYNLKDPRDLDAAYRIVFTGGVTHASTGVTFNGTTGFADTKFNLLTNSTSQTNVGLGLYQRTNTNAGYAMGNIGASDENLTLLAPRLSGSFYGCLGTSSINGHVANVSGLGWYFTCRNALAGTSISLYKNGTNVITSIDENTFVSAKIYIGAVNKSGTGAVSFNGDEQAFALISDSFTDAENVTLNTLIQAFQTTLGRNV